LYRRWIGQRSVRSIGTNTGAPPLAFQAWHRFKEAFPPEFVAGELLNADSHTSLCIDPFGGSGTTALTCQFLGIPCFTVELNPFLADVIVAKTVPYNTDHLAASLGQLRKNASSNTILAAEYFTSLPDTFIQPGREGRWIFDRSIADRVASLLHAIDALHEQSHQHLFRILVGGILADVSNVVVSGKGRRYRRNWQKLDRVANEVDALYFDRAAAAIADIHRFSPRPTYDITVVCQDARTVSYPRADVAIFSPPYPNSFDYTDIYNLELWMLGYIRSFSDNRQLREQTLTSHVQIRRDYAPAPPGSDILNQVIVALKTKETLLWNRWLPTMIGAYFADLSRVLQALSAAIGPGGRCAVVIGDSHYASIHIPSATILADLAEACGWQVHSLHPFRSLPAAAQQGKKLLSETLVILTRSLL